jgi:hypothetical protein
MGYGYAETFLIVFLTHPGVIIPTMSSVTSMIPAELGQVVPSGGFPPFLSAGWQIFWYWILGLPGDKSVGFAWTMYVIYLIFLLAYMYFFLGVRLRSGA